MTTILSALIAATTADWRRGPGRAEAWPRSAVRTARHAAYSTLTFAMVATSSRREVLFKEGDELGLRAADRRHRLPVEEISDLRT